MSGGRCVLFCAVLLLAAAGRAQAQKIITSGALDAQGGLAVEIRSVFNPMPPSGLAPVRVVASNSTGRDLGWDFSFNSKAPNYGRPHTQDSRFQLRTPAGGTTSATWLVPVAVAYGPPVVSYGTNHRLEASLAVPGVATKVFHLSEERAEDLPAIAISPELAAGCHAALKLAAKNRGSASRRRLDVFGSEFALADLPEDWRGLSGFDFLMITEREWLELKSGQRLAVIQWARLGGTLDVFHASPTVKAESLRLPGRLEGDRLRLSLGEARFYPWDARTKTISKVDRYFTAPIRSKHMETLRAGHTGRPPWSLLSRLGPHSDGYWQALLFLVVFGILVGPVNLFLLAPAGRRHRLFITIPLISAGATLVLCIIILLQDGLGGSGARVAVVDLQPGEAAACITQHQASRSGMLLGADFVARQPLVIEPLALPEDPWVRLNATRQTALMSLSLEGARHGGTFFQSRSVQAHLLRAVLPTRGRLELKAGQDPAAAPQIVSTLSCALDEVYYCDGSRKLWRSQGRLGTGQTAALSPCSLADVRMKVEVNATHTGARTAAWEEAFRRFQLLEPGTLLATSSAPGPDFMLDSLPSIRWRENTALFTGQVAQP